MRIRESVKDGLVSAGNQETLADHFRNLSSSKERVFHLSLPLFQEDLFLECGDMDDSLQCYCDPRMKGLIIFVDSSERL